jgi:hypothetical protein
VLQAVHTEPCTHFPPTHDTIAGGTDWQAWRPSAQGGQAVPAVAMVKSQSSTELSVQCRGPSQGAAAHVPPMQANTSVLDLQAGASVAEQGPPTLGAHAAETKRTTPTSQVCRMCTSN